MDIVFQYSLTFDHEFIGMNKAMKFKACICILVIAVLATGCGSGQRKVNKSEAAINQERLSLIEDYKKCIKKADNDEAKAEACESHRKAAESLNK